MTGLSQICNLPAMNASFEYLVCAVERLGHRLNMKMERTEGGAVLTSPTPIASEFLPAGKFFRGIFHRSGDWRQWSLQPPYFLVSFQDEKIPLPLIAELTLWEKQPQGVGQSEWKLQRVEEVPTLKDYRELDEKDFLEFGSMDTYTQWFVAYGRDSAGVVAKGKLRITDLDEGLFFASQLFTKEKGEFALLLDSLEAKLQKPFYFASSVQQQFPSERGFHPRAIFRVYHSGMN